jgi:periplasmic protein TonB
LSAAQQVITTLSKRLINKLLGYGGMAIALWVSLLVHAGILTVHFEPEIKKFVNKLPTLEVVLVNAKTKSAPEKADLLAQANLDRGGNTDANRQLKTALPAPIQKTTEVKLKPNSHAQSAQKATKKQAQQAREEKRVAELEKQAQELLTQLNATHTVDSKATQNAAAAEPELGNQQNKSTTKLDREAILSAASEIDRLEAQLAKEMDAYQKRPKKRFLGARTKEASDAMYLEAWRQKVERIGNNNYPQAARDQKIYGQLRMTVEIKSDGTVESITINKSSGSKILDQAAINIVNLAAPYAPFSPEMKRNTDILGITRTWSFTQEDALATE